jgi:hypothetical protein
MLEKVQTSSLHHSTERHIFQYIYIYIDIYAPLVLTLKGCLHNAVVTVLKNPNNKH